jgi:hypothetical protein
MKKLLKISMLLTLLITYSCSESEIIEEQQMQENLILEPIDNMGIVQSTTTCTMYSISYNTTNKTETFGVSSNISNQIYSWSATGTINIVGTNTTSNTVTIQYPTGYKADEGVLIVSVIDSTSTTTNCGVTKYIGLIGTNGNGNCGIEAGIEEQISVGYPTPNGKYSLTYTGSSSNVSWSVTNGTIISSNGKYEVIVKANNLSSIILKATIQEGSCIQTVTEDIMPINNCATSITASIEEDVRPCYPSNNPHGWYTLEYTGTGNVSWSVNYGEILYISGSVQVQVKPSSALPFTLTATITEGACVKTFSRVIYPSTDCETDGPGGGGGGEF